MLNAAFEAIKLFKTVALSGKETAVQVTVTNNKDNRITQAAASPDTLSSVQANLLIFKFAYSFSI